ncbi:MAG: transglutaminase domain-containing protein [Candidatus Onthomonas sp.]
MPPMEAYYYQQLPRLQQSVYHAMEAGLTALSPAFPVPRLEGRELSEILLRLRLDHPEIFYVTGFSYRFRPEASNVELVPEYLFDKGKIRAHQQAMSARIAKLSRPALGKSEWEREQYVHDFICRNVRYDKLKKPYSHEILGPLGQGVSVCEGIAKAVKALCNALGLWCIVAISENNPDKGIKYRHTWNILRLGGKYYHLDATFDNSLGKDGPIRYDYFNLEDKTFFRDHEPVIFPVPACTDGSQAYYRAKKLSFTKEEEVQKRALQAIRKKQPLIFHWRGGYLTREVLAQLCLLLENTAREKELHAQINLNWPQAVFQVSFSAQLPGEEMSLQQANEGELETVE